LLKPSQADIGIVRLMLPVGSGQSGAAASEAVVGALSAEVGTRLCTELTFSKAMRTAERSWSTLHDLSQRAFAGSSDLMGHDTGSA
jgi:hypothetical protein